MLVSTVGAAHNTHGQHSVRPVHFDCGWMHDQPVEMTRADCRLPTLLVGGCASCLLLMLLMFVVLVGFICCFSRAPYC